MEQLYFVAAPAYGQFFFLHRKRAYKKSSTCITDNYKFARGVKSKNAIVLTETVGKILIETMKIKGVKGADSMYLIEMEKCTGGFIGNDQQQKPNNQPKQISGNGNYGEPREQYQPRS